MFVQKNKTKNVRQEKGIYQNIGKDKKKLRIEAEHRKDLITIDSAGQAI